MAKEAEVIENLRSLEWRLSHEQITEDCSEEEKNPTYRESVKCKIFIGFQSNHISSGVTDIIWYLVQHRMVDVIVTEAGGIEQDIIKCLADTYRGDVSLPGAALRSKGLNRIGNLLGPDDNYHELEDWIMPLLDQMFKEQNTHNDIPVFCTDLTVGSFGKLLYFHSLSNPGLHGVHVDVFVETKAMYNEAAHANPRKTGMIILGGGLPKHHICDANMICNGADYEVFINAAQEFDGSDSGASPEEAVSWGKIRASAKFVKVHCDATNAFPLLVAKTFAATIEKIMGSRMGEATKDAKVIENLRSVVFNESQSLEGACAKIHGYDFNRGVNYSQILKSLISTGFQASNLGDAIETVNQMLDWRLSHEQITQDCSEEEKNPTFRESVRCKIFLGFTSNLISSGVRDIIRYLVQHHMGLNRIGNLLVPNDNYCKFEDWVIPIFDKMLEEQNTQNGIPIFCPGLTDGSLGDMLYFQSFRSPGLVVDVVQDIKSMNGEAVHANPRKTWMIILGGGLAKHHICNANMMRNGADFAVFINTAQEFDGSDSGARPDEV
ncbi:hypothetical protein L1987_59776 [Smallanthus sonchifolius]|uniref:Uncharacterized protein n=1 Tax=Smallanthus sonchifolius TaxID=185202 RepID=A0ACB9D6F0_9ASTR|nr:hypothetical protein L1987_59776 [Smallanthus sonchifolius]